MYVRLKRAWFQRRLGQLHLEVRHKAWKGRIVGSDGHTGKRQLNETGNGTFL